MANTLDNLRAEIARLEKQAQEIAAKEKKAAIQEIKALVKKYDITAEDVGLAKKAPANPKATRTRKKAKAKRKASKVVYQFGDLTWSGRGRRPQWALDILENEGEEGLEKYRVG